MPHMPGHPAAPPPGGMPSASGEMAPRARPGRPAPGQPAAPQTATPEEVAAAQQAEQEARLDAMAKMAPQPDERGYSVGAMKALGKAEADALAFLSDNLVPEAQLDVLRDWDAPKEALEGGRWQRPLPPELFLPLVVLFEGARQLGFEEQYALVPSDLVKEAGLRLVTAKVEKMGKDKALKKAGAPAPQARQPVPPQRGRAAPQTAAPQPGGAQSGAEREAILMEAAG